MIYLEGKSDGSADKMTCVLPKSLIDKLDEWALVQPVPFTGGISNMVATGPLRHSAKFGPTIETKCDLKRDSKDDIANEGTKDLKPVRNDFI